ncbi:coiled-coil domain-containing protein 77 [Stigmatopora nigra]
MGSPKKYTVAQRSCECAIYSSRDESSPLPPVNERLAFLRPSKERLDLLKGKIAQFDGEHGQLLKTLEKYKSIIEDQHKMMSDLRQREAEITELKNALSDMQVYLYQEREQSLRLHAENDRLKIRELEDRKKIQQLLALVGSEDGETTYFHREPPHKVTVRQKNRSLGLGDNICLRPTKIKTTVTRRVEASKTSKLAEMGTGDTLEKYKTDNHSLMLQVEALQAQMEEQTRLAREQVETLQEDREIRKDESQAERQRFEKHVGTLTDTLQRTQNLLYESTKDFLKLKHSTRLEEKKWLVEKDRLLAQAEGRRESSKAARARQAANVSAAPPRASPPPPPRHEIKLLQGEITQANRLAEMYREQCVAMEAELAQAREQGEVGQEIFKERTEKSSQRLKMMTQRYEALERRRTLEAEGFKTDLRQLRTKLKDVEKQLLQVMLNVGPNQDLAILQEVRDSNSRTKKVQSDLVTLKAKIYGLENELRHC